MLLNLVSYIDFCIDFTTHKKGVRSTRKLLEKMDMFIILKMMGFMSAHIGPSSSNCVQ